MAAGEVAGIRATRPRDMAARLRPGVPDGTPRDGGPSGVLDGPFTTRQLLRIDEALAVADSETGLTFSVYLGPLEEPTREYAERLHERLPDQKSAVLLAVSPNQRVLEIVTGKRADQRLPRQICALAALSMTAAFGGGDLAGGIVTGLRMLADQASG